MKNSVLRDLGVFDFNEEDELADTYSQWSKIVNPKSDDPAITKYQFLQYASSGSVTQIKEVRTVEHVHVVAIDDDEHDFICDVSRGPLDSLENAGSKRSDGFGATSDRAFEQQHDFNDSGASPKCSSQGMDVRVSSPLRPSPGNVPITSTTPGSPSSNWSVDVEASDGPDSIQESSPSTSASSLEENKVPTDGEAQDQSISGLEMEEMDAIVLHTDYVTYGDKYFPASLILISKNSVKMKASALEEESGAFRSEWEIDDILSIESQWSSMSKIAKVKLRLLTKDAMQAENAQGTSGVEVLEFLIYDPDWSQRQEWIMSLDVRYKAAWSIGMNCKNCDGDPFPVENSECSSDPYIPNFEEPFEEVVYPKGDIDAVSISKRDVDLLQPETFINDTIIDFYIKYIKNGILPQERRRFHFFNSFFFRKLADLDKNPSSAFDSKAAFQRVRKWTRKVNIFEKDYIFIPVNYNLHWSLLVICHPGEVANSNEENMDEFLKVPCILHMDSIRGSHTGLKDVIQRYLLEEWKERQKETSEDISSNFLNLRFLSLELPQQENLSDCGLFLLHYAELFVAEAPVNFSPFQINKFENFLKPDWFIPAEASLKRVHIQRLIYELVESHSMGSEPPFCNHESHPFQFPENNEIDNSVEIISERRSPGKSWNGNLSLSQPGQGMEMGLLDMSLYRTSQCINDSGLIMRELLEQCQHYDQGASFGQLGCPMSPIKEEVETDEHLAHSTLDQTEIQPIDGISSETCHIGYSSRGFGDGFSWNPELSDQVEPEGGLSPGSNYSSDDSEEMKIIEHDSESQGGDLDQNQNQNLDKSEENMDNLTESYASASSDMMETPAEDSQELHKICQQEHKDEDDNGVVCVNDKSVVEDSSSDSDEEQASKRIRLDLPSLGKDGI